MHGVTLSVKHSKQWLSVNPHLSYHLGFCKAQDRACSSSAKHAPSELSRWTTQAKYKSLFTRRLLQSQASLLSGMS